ncbi:MAG: transcription elongation factor GreA [Bacteroidetes bacterium]|nr:transcription elongation factor GreA [Bacteroidota bacterium]PHX83205.1 MAG: transcription elongation factor GreA [Flavobacteriales bacterium]
MSEIIYFTESGLIKIKEELHFLKTKERTSISRQIAEARDKGDLSENAEYDAAKEAQGLLEAKISKIQGMVNNARIVDETNLDIDKVLILCKVTIKNLKSGQQMTYTLVPETEADLKTFKLSVNSPISKGLLGKKVGDIANVTVPAGALQFEIIEISR